MRIAFIEPHLDIFGGIRRVIEFSNRFVERGADVTIYHPTGKPCSWMPSSAGTRKTQDIYRESHDILIFNNPPDYKIARRARATLKVFYILALYERDKLKRFDPKIFWPRKGRMLSLKRCLQLPFLKVSNATWMQEWLRANLGLNTLLQLGGVNRELFHPVDGARRDDGVFRILCSGDARTHKGTATVREAVDRVRHAHPHVELNTYHGRGIPQNEMAAFYAAHDLFVDAQWYAGWNNPVVEAMACGVPVVCSDIGGVADFAFHERTALLAPLRDTQALADAISRMVDTPTLREELSRNALDRVEEFDWERAADDFLALLERECVSAREAA